VLPVALFLLLAFSLFAASSVFAICRFASCRFRYRGVAQPILVSGDEADVRFRERDKGLELVAARFAFPQMSHAMPVQVFGPFGQEDRLPALGTVIQQPSLDVFFSGARSSELHDVSSAMLLPLPMAGDGSATATTMKQ
jgi:hypothetical protein